MAAELGKEMLHLGFKPDERAFVPHLTVGRVKSGDDASVLLDPFRSRLLGSSLISELILFESKTRPTGSVYTVDRSFPLGNDGSKVKEFI